MGILSGKQLQDFHRQFNEDLNNKLDAIDKKYSNIDNTKPVDNTDLQAAILLHLRQERQEKLNRLIIEQAKDTWENQTKQEIHEKAANEIYTKTPEYRENDHYITNRDYELCEAFYKK